MNYIKVGVRETKVNLSKLLKKLGSDNVIIITDHGKPIAKLIKHSDRDLDLSQKIEELESIGILKQLTKEYKKRLPPALVLKGINSQKYLENDRNKE